MNLLLGTHRKTFSLLSIGQRGVGKTVFLAGSYAEIHSAIQTSPQKLRFDCKENQVQANIEKILSYVEDTGEYPPSTMKVENFNFSLKRRGFLGDQTLCHFRWWEIPGEICQKGNPDFLNMVSSSHGCCVFIDAYALTHEQAYMQELEDIIEMASTLASLVFVNKELKYAFALILTKCDLLEADLFSQQQLQKQLQPLTTRLDEVKANYEIFYSHIPIVHTGGASTLKAKGAAAPLLWLVWELNKAHNPGWLNNLIDLLTRLLPTGSKLQQALQELDDGSIQRLFEPWNIYNEKERTIKKLLSARRRLLLLSLAIVGAVGVVNTLALNESFHHKPKNLEALRNIATLEHNGQLDQAVSLMEQLVEQEPEDLDLRLQLADLYEVTGKATKAEAAYDQVLAQQKDNLDALVGKAKMRKVQGDIKTAKELLAQAQKTAPTDQLKAQIRAVAQRILNSPSP
jgi:tetratricopeptide (TPR) repeat protein